jgi:hypothetical protein
MIASTPGSHVLSPWKQVPLRTIPTGSLGIDEMRPAAEHISGHERHQ